MIIGIDNSPLVSTHKLAHKIRGTGFYTKNLIESLKKYHPENEYILFVQGDKLPSSIELLHYPYFDPFFLSLPLLKKVKSVVTIHDLTPLVFPKLFPVGIKGSIKYKIQKTLVKNYEAIITDSNSSKKDIEKNMHISPQDIFSVYLAAGEHFKKINISEKRRKELYSKYTLPETFVLYVGDATPNKNLARLVDSAILANVPLLLVGGALENSNVKIHPWTKDLLYVQKIAKENKNIRILGFVPDDDLVALYNLASVFVFPSLYEGFGLPVLEAASCGCPVITSKSGSLPEVMGDAAYYVNPENTAEIAQAIRVFVTDGKMRTDYSKKAISQSGKFSWKATADATIKVYEKVLKEA